MISERLREARDALEISQQAMADQLGVSLRSQQNYEAGKRSPDAEYLAALAKKGVDIQYILTGERRATAPQLAPDEEALLKHYRQLDPGAKQILLSTCNLFAGQSAAPSSGISVSGTGNRVAGRDYNEG